jgi:hypothetical protein
MPADKPAATFTITIRDDDGEGIEIVREPVDIFAEHPPFAADFYRAIGKILIQSAEIEHLLGHVVSMCRKIETESPPKSKKIREAGRKIEAIREALKKGRLFGEPGEDPLFASILNAAAQIGKKRNDLVHGVVIEFGEGSPARMKLMHDDPDDLSARPRESSYTLQDLEEFLRRMQEAHLFLGGLGAVIEMSNVASSKA